MKLLNIYGETCFEIEAVSILELVEKAVQAKARLDGASLDGASLDGASLDGASLVGASLVGASLDGASLVGARLDGARLDGARLDGARLVGASLVGASLDGARLDGARLVGARLDGARLNWQSHALLGEILRREAGKDLDKRMVAGLILVSRDWCWQDFAQLQHPLKPWALATLAKYLKEGQKLPIPAQAQEAAAS